MKSIREVIASLLGGKSASEASVAELDTTVAELEGRLASAQADAVAARQTAENLAAQAAFSGLDADRVVDQAEVKATRADKVVKDIAAALAGARRLHASALDRERRAELRAWRDRVHGLLEQRKAAIAELERITHEQAEAFNKYASVMSELRRELPSSVQERTPKPFLVAAGVARQLNRRLVAATQGGFGDAALNPREFSAVLTEKIDLYDAEVAFIKGEIDARAGIETQPTEQAA